MIPDIYPLFLKMVIVREETYLWLLNVWIKCRWKFDVTHNWFNPGKIIIDYNKIEESISFFLNFIKICNDANWLLKLLNWKRLSGILLYFDLT